MLHRTLFGRAVAIGGTIVLAIVVLIAARTLLRFPSNDRNWTTDQSRLAHATFNGPLVTIRDIRNFRYASETDYTPGYYDKTFDLRKLDSVWFVVEPFGSWQGPAHTFVSFGFDGGRDFVAVSVEIRKEKGESFSALKGLQRQYEIAYVVGDERDLIGLRANHRNDEVYLYPVKTTRERMRTMFVEMLTRANGLRERPEFYNTIANNCTTNIARHVNTVVPRRVPVHFALVLPGYADRLAWRLGLINSNLPFDETRRTSLINERARKYADDPHFSQRIRGIQ